MCCLNNQEIDFSKTMFRSEMNDEELKKRIDKYKRGKLPYLFKYAKGKKKGLHLQGNMTMDRIANAVSTKRLSFKSEIKGDWKRYELLKSDSVELKPSKKKNIIDKYEELNKSKSIFIKNINKSNNKKGKNYFYIHVANELSLIRKNKKAVTDVLIDYLYRSKSYKSKETLWGAFGDVIVQNINDNKKRFKDCERCGKLIVRKQGKKFCAKCAEKNEQERER